MLDELAEIATGREERRTGRGAACQDNVAHRSTGASVRRFATLNKQQYDLTQEAPVIMGGVNE